jgi:uncharacterized protein YutE (UPF0331/DUF86 family)
MDIVAMYLKDKGKVAKGDKLNIKMLESLNIIDSELAIHLKKCNGLRNFLAHRYNGIDREIVLKSIPDVKKTMIRFITLMGEILDGY